MQTSPIFSVDKDKPQCQGRVMKNELTPLRLAIAIAGSQTNLARAVGVKKQSVSMWLKVNRVPADHCPAIERHTAILAADLRPDVFGVKP